MSWLYFFVLALSTCHLSLQMKHVVSWSPAGVAAVNKTVAVDIGDQLVLMCVNGSFSNLVGLENEWQFNSCNASDAVKDVRFRFRGFCYGRESPLNLNIEQPSAKLPSDLGFVEGATTYLTSFSTGMTLASANADKVLGGECLDGLKLAVYVRDSRVTTRPAPTRAPTDTSSNELTTASSNAPPRSQSLATQTQFLSPLTAQGVVSGGDGVMCSSIRTNLLMVASALFTSTLLLRIFS